MKKVIALSKPLIDPLTEAPVSVFEITRYSVQTKGTQMAQAILQGYVSLGALERGKPLQYTRAIDVAGTPEGDTLQWLYKQIPLTSKPLDDGKGGTIEGNELFGATAIEASETST